MKLNYNVDLNKIPGRTRKNSKKAEVRALAEEFIGSGRDVCEIVGHRNTGVTYQYSMDARRERNFNIKIRKAGDRIFLIKNN